LAVTVVGFAGSPRKNGNTEMLLDWCLEAARQEGADVIKFRLCDLDLHGCRGCGSCSKTGVCAFDDDDMSRLYPYLRNADSIVLAAPVYHMGMPAIPKIMIDRCQPFWALKYVLGSHLLDPGAPKRRGAFLSCAGTDFSKVFDGTRQVVDALWHILEVESIGELLCPGIDAAGEIENHPSARVVAADIGRRLAELREG
jgi:hypothetical protein